MYYLYTFPNSTRFSNWHKELNELFIRVRIGEILIPVYVDLTSSEEEFVGSILEGVGFVLADRNFDIKKILNKFV